MILEFVKKWDLYKEDLKNSFTYEINSYLEFVKKLFENVINRDYDSYDSYNINKIKVIDDGDYQGTKLFIIPKNVYQPSPTDYLITSVGYGSCSGCDTLQGINSKISDYDNITEDTKNQYLTLCLHLLQNLKFIYED